MSDVMRHRRGVMNLDTFPISDTATIEIGDLLVLHDSNNILDISVYGGTADYKVYPFSAVSPLPTGVTTASIASEYFAGVAMQASDAVVNDKIRVAESGDFEFDLDSSTTIYAKDYIAAYTSDSASGGSASDQTVTKDSTANMRIGRAVNADGSTESTVWVRIATKYTPDHRE